MKKNTFDQENFMLDKLKCLKHEYVRYAFLNKCNSLFILTQQEVRYLTLPVIVKGLIMFFFN